jgi:hypothetical protein
MPLRDVGGLDMIRSSMWFGSITGLAALLAIIATGITTQWQREHHPTQLVRSANLSATRTVPRLCQELLTRAGVVIGHTAWARCAIS